MVWAMWPTVAVNVRTSIAQLSDVNFVGNNAMHAATAMPSKHMYRHALVASDFQQETSSGLKLRDNSLIIKLGDVNLWLLWIYNHPTTHAAVSIQQPNFLALPLKKT